jgi:hypothetical protein
LQEPDDLAHGKFSVNVDLRVGILWRH